MTENSCGTITTNGIKDEEVFAGSVGRPLPGVEVKIIDPETLQDVDANTEGELCTRGYMQFLGYVNDEEKTAESLLPGGWWRTGDLAILDSEKDVYRIQGRSKDMIIRGGENIQPTEIENYYAQHDGVEDVYVIGVPSRRLGEEVAAYISLNDKNIKIEEMREFGLSGLSRYKVPKYFKFVSEFPKTVTGKIKKFELREMALVDF